MMQTKPLSSPPPLLEAPATSSPTPPAGEGPGKVAVPQPAQPTRSALALVSSAGWAKPTDPLVAMRGKEAGAVRLGGSGAAVRLPSEKDAKAAISKVLPDIAAAVSKHTNGKLTTNDASCEVAAGLTLGKPKQLGFDARLNDAAGHITVRVRTAGKELIVDPTMSQFFADGSPIGNDLRDKGGFVGTEDELRGLIEREAGSWSYDTQEYRDALRDILDDTSVSKEDRAVALGLHVKDTTDRLFDRHVPSALLKSAQMLAQRVSAFELGNVGVVRNENERAAFELLRDE